MTVAEPLKLVALDEEDLAVLSAHAQDAVVTVGELAYRPKEQRFALAMNRFDWEEALAGGRKRSFVRRRTILHFDRVRKVETSHINRRAAGAVLELLAIAFGPGDSPAGHITLTFAGGGAVRLEVECIEAYLTDLSAAWETKVAPAHDLAEAPASDRNRG